MAIWLSRTDLLSTFSTSISAWSVTWYLFTPTMVCVPRVDARLRARGSLLDAHLGNAGRDGLGHAAQLFHLGDMRLSLAHQLVGQPLDVVAAAPRIGDAAGAALLLDEQLRVAGDARGEIRRQCDRLVQRIGVQRLRAAVRRRQRLDAGARHVVEDVLRGKAPAAGLAMRAQRQRLGILGRELILDQLRPQQARGPHLGDLHEEVHADRPEERQPRRERVDVEAGRHARAHVLDAVGQRVGEFQVRRRAGLLHVIAGDGDGVELRHLRARVGEDVGDDAHRRIGRIDVGVAHHELFEDVVLDGAGELAAAPRPAPRPPRCTAPAPAAPRRSWSSTRSCRRAWMPSNSVRMS